MKNLNFLLKISVIIPVYNAKNNLEKLIETLINQDYPSELLEIIFVDNNSTDDTYNLLEKSAKTYPFKVLKEKIQSSYAARNRGILNSKYDIIAFTDSDCIADSKWILNGINTLINEQADIVGGEIQFYFSDSKTAAEIFDALTSMGVKRYITERKVAPTANLIVRKTLFDAIGLFPVVKSGGDILWTKKATDAGYKLIYAPNAVVRHPTRKLGELLKKHYRVGTGLVSVRSEEWGWQKKILSGLKLLIPERPSYIRKLIQERGTPDMNKKFWKIWAISYVCNLMHFLGIVRSYLCLH